MSFNLRAKIRKQIDLLYIYSSYFRVSNYPYRDKGLEIISKLKICLVKQENYTDLYTNPQATGLELLYSTIHRSGPVGLFDARNFDFRIIRLNESEESRIWEHLAEDVGGESPEACLNNRYKIFVKESGETINSVPQTELAIHPSAVDWNQYDIVVSINFSLEGSLTKNHPNVLWCYMPQEPALRHYKLSQRAPLYAYDIFLNQQFTLKLKGNKKHEINFPYNLMHTNSFRKLVNTEAPHREGVFVENHSLRSLDQNDIRSFAEFGETRHPKEESYASVLSKMLRSKYFFSLRKNDFKIWGNSMIDAVGSGLLSFGNPNEYVNVGLFTPFTVIKSPQEFIDKVAYLENNPRRYEKELKFQKKLLDKYCFFRPIRSLSDSMKYKQKKVSSRSDNSPLQ